jgi:hypothetical protein
VLLMGERPKAPKGQSFVVIFPLAVTARVLVPVARSGGMATALRQGKSGGHDDQLGRFFWLQHGVPSSLGGVVAWIVGILVVIIPLYGRLHDELAGDRYRPARKGSRRWC